MTIITSEIAVYRELHANFCQEAFQDQAEDFQLARIEACLQNN